MGVQITEIESSELALECSKCNEKIVLLGQEGDWHSEWRTAFECGGYGENLTLIKRIVETPGAANGI